MKLNEFETRLSSVSDAKLRLMYEDSSEKGPAVAVELIRAEAERRGLDLDSGIRAASTGKGETPEGETPKGAWLTEETTSSGLPMTVKILLAVTILGGIGVGVFMVLARG